jgi:hypothetical protein
MLNGDIFKTRLYNQWQNQRNNQTELLADRQNQKISKITAQAAKACPEDMKTQLFQSKHQKRFKNMANLIYFKYIWSLGFSYRVFFGRRTK